MKRQPNSRSEDAAVSEVRAVYEELARRPIERQCTARTECCQFRLTGRTPYLTRGEAIVARRAWKASGRKEVGETAEGSCPMLDGATLRCRIYESRPFGCRTHFCEAAGGPYARREVADLIHRLEEIDARFGGTGAQKITTALRAAS